MGGKNRSGSDFIALTTCCLVDENLDDRRLDELHRWAERKTNFVVIDSDTGEDITRIMLA
ncbi:MAG: polyhydroxyalkanoate synthesis regulator DNA-binding domain-containing protein [Xanthobacteraceae bacterium]|nr:polyhydroxyalkanoate synthesis regulator DNA-binding domain-containing protein [Xanthobacteraceae bacterium]